MDDQLSFGQWLRRRRKALHLTQQQLGELASCATSTIRKYEADSRRPDYDILIHLATALQISECDHAAFFRFAGGSLFDVSTYVPPPSAPERRPLHAPSNIPEPLTPLIGRVDEVAATAALLERSDVRLVTLTGPGGVGKTHLSIAIARSLRGAFVDGMFFVDLSPLTDPKLMLATIAQVLHVQEVVGQSLLTTVQAHLRDRQILLLLDNIEQILTAGLTIVDLLQSTARLKVLATSRIPLHVRGEREVVVEPLSLPHAPADLDTGMLSRYDAVRLFVERAQAVNTHFQVTCTNAAAVAGICIRLDGLPLAIELAAARIKLLTPQVLHQCLVNPFEILTGGTRDMPERHQTMRHTIDWSYHLLNAEEQALFRRLAVFEGEFTLLAVAKVCMSEGGHFPHTLDTMQSLVDQSMVQTRKTLYTGPEQGNREIPFRVLETVREYAFEQLCVHGEVEAMQHKHAWYYLLLAEKAACEMFGAQGGAWMNQLEKEAHNLRRALSWAMERHDIEMVTRFCVSLSPFWRRRGHRVEGYQWLTQVLSLTQHTSTSAGDASVHQLGRTPVLAQALRWAGTFSMYFGDFDKAIELHRRGLELWQELGDMQGFAQCLKQVGWSNLFSGNH